MTSNTLNFPLGKNVINGAPIKVMIVDDMKVIRMILKQVLLSEGFEVILEAGNGEEALGQLREVREKPEILFIDKEMPVKDGIATINELHPSYPNIKIIMVTSIKDTEIVTQAIKLGISGYILKPQPDKPFDRNEFLERIAGIIGRTDYVHKYIV